MPESEAVRLARVEERQRATEELLRPFGEISGQVINAAADVQNLQREGERMEKRLTDMALAISSTLKERQEAFSKALKESEDRQESRVRRVEEACASVKTASIQGRYAVIAALVGGAMAIILKLVA